MAVELKSRHKVNVNGKIEIGPLVADDTGLAVIAKRKMFTRSHPGTYYIVKWADVTAWNLGLPQQVNFAGSTVNSHHSQLEVRTASKVISLELPLSQGSVANLVGKYLADKPRG